MGDEAELSVLRRKTGGGRAAQGAPAMTPDKALRTAAARAGDAALSARVSVRGLDTTSDFPETLTADLPDPALVALLEGPDGARGLAVACPQLVAAAIEAQTLGEVLPGEAALRPPTGIDAAMLAEFINHLLRGFGTFAADCGDLPPIDGFRFAQHLADARAGAMALADAGHLRVSAELDIGLGAKTGRLFLIFPAERRAPAQSEPGGQWRTTLQRSVLGTEARLDAVLCRLRRPLCDITRLAEGETLILDAAALDGLTLRGPDDNAVMTGKLGRSGAMRAVRVQFVASGDLAPKTALDKPDAAGLGTPDPDPTNVADQVV
ncbi:MAG: FliM/FliN family flagellar motor switch protein [Rhodobacter sp.]|nr:FliM/FliN family flagellar motor switch protein [Rhodobacter sp.]